jgi:hypothetical protein
MHDFPWFWVLFGILFWMLVIRPRRLSACEGRWARDATRDRAERPPRRARRVELDGALAERDALLAKLEERVRVLERIATDDSARLRAEIDGLRDTRPAQR